MVKQKQASTFSGVKQSASVTTFVKLKQRTSNLPETYWDDATVFWDDTSKWDRSETLTGWVKQGKAE